MGATRKYLLLALLGPTVLFMIFKLLYPYPDFTQDSHSYIYAAAAHLNVNIYPIGYSKFLSAFHYLTPSGLALVLLQYFILIASAIYFFFTFIKYHEFSKLTRDILFCFLFFNPLFLYLANYISYDALFTALSLVWFAQLVSIINNPRPNQIYIQAILILLCVTLSNAAWYYPIIGAIALILSSRRLWAKFAGISLPVLLLISFVLFSRNEAYKITGTNQYPLSSGWQLANNALYIFEYTDTGKFTSSQIRELEKSAGIFYTIPPKALYSQSDDFVGDFFLHNPKSPLKIYAADHFKITNDSIKVVNYAKASVLFGEYGRYQVGHNPAAYFWNYALPNVKTYLFPGLGDMKVYNQNQDKIDSLSMSWFQYKTTKIHTVSKTLKGILLSIFPTLYWMMIIFWIVLAIRLLMGKKLLLSTTRSTTMLTITGSLLLANFLSSIFITPLVFRNQIFILASGFSFSLLLIELLDRQKTQENKVIKMAPNNELKESVITN